MPGEPVRLLFVCLGNICRSPTAEGVMRSLVEQAGMQDQIEIDSAGTGAWHVGSGADARASSTARARGVTLESVARQVVLDDFEAFDVVLAMDAENLRALRRLAGNEQQRAKIHLLREFDPASVGAADLDVPDPYYGGDGGFEEVFELVQAACAGLLERIRAGELVSLPAGASEASRVGGGDINEAFRVVLADGRAAFVKTRADAPRGEYAAEAAGLRWLAEPGALRTPEVLEVTEDHLALEWIEWGALSAQGAEEFGRGLAETHAAGARGFGTSGTSGFGWLRLSNERTADWASFYAQRRLAPMARIGAERGVLSVRAVAWLERVCERLPALVGPAGGRGAAARRSVGRQRAGGQHGATVADRPGGLRRAPRGGSGDAQAVRHAGRRADAGGVRGAEPAG